MNSVISSWLSRRLKLTLSQPSNESRYDEWGWLRVLLVLLRFAQFPRGTMAQEDREVGHVVCWSQGWWFEPELRLLPHVKGLWARHQTSIYLQRVRATPCTAAFCHWRVCVCVFLCMCVRMRCKLFCTNAAIDRFKLLWQDLYLTLDHILNSFLVFNKPHHWTAPF